MICTISFPSKFDPFKQIVAQIDCEYLNELRWGPDQDDIQIENQNDFKSLQNAKKQPAKLHNYALRMWMFAFLV